MRIIQESKRFNVVDCGRRFGKTQLGIDRAITPQTLTAPVGWFSPSYRMMLEVWRSVAELLAPITLRRNASERRIELTPGGVLEFWSLDNPDLARGRKYKRIIADEAAMVSNLMDSWNHIIRPTLIDMEGDAWFLSTPKGMNAFWQMYQWGLDESMPDWASWTKPTSDNPFISDSEIEAMRRSMPERVYKQEILAQFLGDAGGVFRYVMDAATVTEMEGASPVREVNYIFGVDWGKHNDFTVITVMDADNKSLVYMDRFNQIDYTVQSQRLKALYDRFKPSQIIAEKNSMGEPIIEQLQRDGLPVRMFNTTNATKVNAIEALSNAFERHEIKIINDPILIGELQAYEILGRTQTGATRYGAPEGMHDDCVMSLAIAWQAIDDGPLLMW